MFPSNDSPVDGNSAAVHTWFLGTYRRPTICQRCGATHNFTYVWRRFSNGTDHIATHCRCGRFLCWAHQTPENVALADASATT
jgi:hypothetical protein